MEIIKERTVGWLLVSGAVISMLSFVLLYMFIGGGVMHGARTRDPLTDEIKDPGDLNLAPLAFLGMTTGVVMVGGGLGYGIWLNKKRFDGPRRLVQNAKVIGRYGYTRDWQMLSTDWDFSDIEGVRYMVQLQLGPGPASECECSPETFAAAGEGMHGDAELEGKWLGKFTPYIGIPQAQG